MLVSSFQPLPIHISSPDLGDYIITFDYLTMPEVLVPFYSQAVIDTTRDEVVASCATD
jgi:hypothetical protein